MRSLAAALVVSLALTGAAHADVLHVPGDFATIQAAVDASVAGDTILIASGTYTEGVTLSGLSDRVLRGQGKVELTNDTIEPGLTITGCSNISVERLRFRDLSVGLQLIDVTDILVSRCRAETLDEAGFVVLGGNGVVFDRCVVTGAGDVGVNLLGLTGGALRRCRVQESGVGLVLNDCVAVEVDRLRVAHVPGTGLLVGPGSRSLDVHHARLLDIGSIGIDVQGDDNRFRHDLVVDPDGVGIQLGPSADRNVLDHERVVDSGGTGIHMGGTLQEARSCRALQAGEAAFILADAGPHLVQDCRVVKSGAAGVFVDGGVNPCTLLDNRMSHTHGSGINTDRDATVIGGNVVTGAGGDGFFIDSNQNLVTGNKVHGSAGFDLNEVTDGDSIFLDNSFGTEQHP